MTKRGEINLKTLISTRDFLADIIKNAQNDYEKAGSIQAFEVSYELAKNTIRKVLVMRAQETPITPKFLHHLDLLINELKTVPECYN